MGKNNCQLIFFCWIMIMTTHLKLTFFTEYFLYCTSLILSKSLTYEHWERESQELREVILGLDLAAEAGVDKAWAIAKSLAPPLWNRDGASKLQVHL